MKVYGIIIDGGDGSAGISWFTNEDVVNRLLSDDEEAELYYMNEGSPAVTLELPDDTDLKAIGLRWVDEE